MVPSPPVLKDSDDLKVWYRLDEISRNLMSDRRRSRYLSDLRTMISDLTEKEDPLHPAISLRLLRMAEEQKLGDLKDIALKVAGKCGLSDSLPTMKAADILISHGETHVAKSLLDRLKSVSDRAIMEYEYGRILMEDGKKEEALGRFRRSYSVNDLFLPNYDAMEEAEPGGGWRIMKNIALIHLSLPVEPLSESLAITSAEDLYGIYWEWANGNRRGARAAVEQSSEYASRLRDFMVAEARMLAEEGEYNSAIEIYEELTENPEESVALSVELGNVYMSASLPGKALELFKRLEMSDPYDRRVLEGCLKASADTDRRMDLKRYSEIYLDAEYADLDAYALCIELMGGLSLNQEANALVKRLSKRCPDTARKHLLVSRSDMDLSRYQSALASASKAVKMDPDDPEIRTHRASIYLQTGKARKAMADVNAVLGKNKNYIPALSVKKDIHQSEGNMQEAHSTCKLILSLDPRNAGAMKDAAGLLDRMGMYDESFAMYREALGIKEDVSLFSKVMIQLQSSGRYREMVALVQEHDDIYGDYAEIWALKGNAEFALERYGDAAASFAKAVSLSPGDPSLWHSRGLAEEFSGRLEEAETAFDRAVLIDLDNQEYWISKASVQEKLGNNSGAISSLNRVISQSPDNTYALVQKARILVKVGETEDAMYFLDTALRVSPSDTGIRRLKRDIYKHEGDTERTIEECRIIVKLDGKDAGAYLDMADAYISMGDIGQAMAAINAALGKGLEDVQLLSKKADILKMNESFSEEIRVRKSVLLKDPGNTDAKLSLAEAFMRIGDKSSADEIYGELQKNDPGNVEITVRKAVVTSDAGDGSQAISLFREALYKDPDNTEILLGLANALRESGSDSEAESMLDKALQKDPGLVKAYTMKAGIRSEMGDDEGARSVLEEAMEFASSDPEIWRALGSLQESDRDYSHAMISFDTAIKLGDDSSGTYLKRGLMQEAMGATDQALNSYGLALAKEPNSTEALTRLGALQASSGRESVALRYLETAARKDPKYVPAIIERARIYARHKDAVALRRAQEQFTKSEPTREQSVEFAEILRDSGVEGDLPGIMQQTQEEHPEEIAAEDPSYSRRPLGPSETAYYAKKLIRSSYISGKPMADPEPIEKAGIPPGQADTVLAYLADIRDYGEIDPSSEEFSRLENLSKNVIIKEKLEDIENEPMVTMQAAFMSSGVTEVEEIKTLIAYIHRVMTSDFEAEIFSDRVRNVLDSVVSGSGDISVYEIIKEYGVGVYTARTVKMLATSSQISEMSHI